MRALFIGDVVGSPGRTGLREMMPQLRERYAPDLVIVNGENSAGGMGITERTANDLFGAGTDVITTGNHVYRHREAYDFLDRPTGSSAPPTTRRGTRAAGTRWSRSRGCGCGSSTSAAASASASPAPPSTPSTRSSATTSRTR